MKEFEGLKVPYEGKYCDNNSCIGLAVCCEECIFNGENHIKYAKYILSHHTPITENILPFGMLSKEKQEELKIANNENANYSPSNIQFYSVSNKDWINENPSWHKCVIYRLDPTYKPKKMRKMTLEEIWDKRKEWRFLHKCEVCMINTKLVDDDDNIIEIYLSDFVLNNDNIKNFLYSKLGESEDFKPLPEMECEG